MNLALYYHTAHRRAVNRRDENGDCQLEEAAPPSTQLNEAGGMLQRVRQAMRSQGHPVQPSTTQAKAAIANPASNTTIGFWLIPDGDAYSKLKILSTYLIKNTDGESSEPGFNPAQAYPIWPVLVNRKMLGQHFRWLLPLTGRDYDEKEALYNPDSSEYDGAASTLCQGLFARGWRYVVVRGDVAYFGGARQRGSTYAGDPIFLKLLEEVLNGKVQRPTAVNVSFQGVQTIKFMDANGEAVGSMNASDLPVNRSQQPAQQGQQPARSVEQELRKAISDDTPWIALALLIRDVKLSQVDQLNFELLSSLMAPRVFMTHIKQAVGMLKSPRVPWKVSQLIHIFIDLCNAHGVQPPDPQLYGGWLNESRVELPLNEANYLDLWNATRANGDYKYGGMRRIHGRWIYDPSVRGRTQNGKRFVTVAPPKPSLDRDGKVVLRFRYQSKPARSTTGVSQIGYVKFINHAAFMKTASRNITLALKARDVHVQCSCPDFKYRWHWVLAHHNSAPQPTGLTDQPPDQTNPNRKIAMCKHLTACSPFILFRPQSLDRELRQLFKQIRSAPVTPAPGDQDGAAPVVKPDANIDTDGGETPEPEEPDIQAS